MTAKEFQLNFTDGSITVQCFLNFDGSEMSVSGIMIDSNFDAGLPHDVEMVSIDGKWRLRGYIEKADGTTAEQPHYFIDNQYANAVIENLLQLMEEERSRPPSKY